MNRKAILRSVLISSALMLSITAGLTTSVYAEPPAKPPENSNSTTTHIGEYIYRESISESEKSFTSSSSGKNTILVTDGTVNFLKSIITKSGDDNSGDTADFYGTNAAILSINSSKIKIIDSEITTNAKHANAVFAFGDSTIDISNSKINTTGDNSGAIMVTGGGTLNATKVTAETEGNSSAPIRSDRGGGTITVSGGEFTSHGNGSPAVYSTANITVKDEAKLESTASEGIVIEGSNSVALEDSSLIANNTVLHGNSETYKSVFIYQSMSGDAEEGTGTFTAKNSTITTKNGDAIFVTNTNATISLEKTTFSHGEQDVNNFAILRVQKGKWGTNGKNGGNVTLTATKTPLEGNIIVDNISTSDITLSERSEIYGAINPENTARSLKITLDEKSRIVLTADSYITELNNAVKDNSNIYANGHKLFVNGAEVSINQSKPEEWVYDMSTDSTEPAVAEAEPEEEDKSMLFILLIISSIAFIASLFAVVFLVSNNKKRKQAETEKQAIEKVAKNTLKKPWEKA